PQARRRSCPPLRRIQDGSPRPQQISLCGSAHDEIPCAKSPLPSSPLRFRLHAAPIRVCRLLCRHLWIRLSELRSKLLGSASSPTSRRSPPTSRPSILCRYSVHLCGDSRFTISNSKTNVA